jgi:hypothetical protein
VVVPVEAAGAAEALAHDKPLDAAGARAARLGDGDAAEEAAQRREDGGVGTGAAEDFGHKGAAAGRQHALRQAQRRVQQLGLQVEVPVGQAEHVRGAVA